MNDQLLARTMAKLRDLCGYVENGTSGWVTLSQDDATKDWCVTVGCGGFQSNMYDDTTLAGAVDKAFDAECQED